MKNILKFVFIASMFLFVSVTQIFAEELLQENSDPQVIIFAEIDLINSKIVSQKENTFNISFSISNKKGLQSGIKYGVELASFVNGEYEIVDQKIYDEVLSLPENSKIEKEITYVAPGVLSGKYTIFLTILNENGFSFSKNILKEVELASTMEGVRILPESCSLSVKEEKGSIKYKIYQGVDIDKAETLVLNCTAVNASKEKIEMIPVVKIQEGSASGKTISDGDSTGEKITFAPQEKKSFSVVISGMTNPKIYYASISLKAGETISNTVNTTYIVRGKIATIENLFFDKDYYNKGDTANLSLMWNSVFGPGLRDKKIEMGVESANVDISITDVNGKICGTLSSKTIDNKLVKIEIPVQINKKCFDPKVSVTLKNIDTGDVLDQKTFETKTTTFEKSKSNPWMIVIIALLVLGILFLLKKKVNKSPTTNTSIGILFLFILVGFSFLIQTNKTEAASYSVNSGGCTMAGSFGPTKSEFYNNEKISFIATAKLSGGSSCNSSRFRGYVALNTPNSNNAVTPIIGVLAKPLGQGFIAVNPTTGVASLWGTHVEGVYSAPIIVKAMSSTYSYSVSYTVLPKPMITTSATGGLIESGLTDTINWQSSSTTGCTCRFNDANGAICEDYNGNPVADPLPSFGSFETNNLTEKTKYFFTCSDGIEDNSLPSTLSYGLSYRNGGTCTVNSVSKNVSCTVPAGGFFCTGGSNEQSFSSGACPYYYTGVDNYLSLTADCPGGEGSIGVGTLSVCFPYGA